ncbi:ComEC/Rec2 family competence protein [Clostridium saccharobutylicum]|uniref:Hydroxyacylglutathione hydrolase n=1 Tax=Clostridium saccharobutylicum TaxID=169679 RepID=A0A1S8NAY6_CLOSA|nr:ComEC/Rec2 family competence protein [Clostridium saccharobutylicum]OOM13552.1 hydroxyacylglutathione hydrolase [Clostridium saccharobutylicum]
MIKHYRINHKHSFLYLFIILFFTLIASYNILLTSKDDSSQVQSNKMLVHYIDVGQGDCILIQVNNKNLLIDSGPKSDKKKLLNYLNSLNFKKLDYVIATHPHEDHIGNMANVINSYKINAFYAPKIQSNTKTFENMVDALKSKKLKINVIKRGTDSINLGNDTRVTIFSPTKNDYENLNNYSPVMKIEYGKTSFLFTGDAQNDIEEEILSNNDDISADILKIGHHGSSTSTSENFLKKVNPSIGVISVGEGNVYNHPNDDIIKRLKKNKVTIYRTDINGTIILSSDGKSITKN